MTKFFCEYAAAVTFVFIETKSLFKCWVKNGQPVLPKDYFKTPPVVRKLATFISAMFATVLYLGIGLAGNLSLMGLLAWTSYIAACIVLVHEEIESKRGPLMKFSFLRELGLVSFEVGLLAYFGFCKDIF